MSNNIKTALEAIKNGKLIGLPTETVYGLAAPFNNLKLVEKIFKLKERPFYDPLIIHGHSLEQLKPLVKSWPEICNVLAKKFWPGPLTFVLEKNPIVDDMITAGLETVGIRIPNNETSLHLLKELNIPMAAPSANLFKKLSPTKAQDVIEVFSEDDVFVLQDDRCEVGIESTIIKIDKNLITILRPGIIEKKEIENCVSSFGYKVELSSNEKIISPGQMEEHYCPTKPLHLFIAENFEQAKENAEGNYEWATLPENHLLAARTLYGTLRSSSQTDKEMIALYINDQFLLDDRWVGILDRLKRASTKIINPLGEL